MDQDDAAVQGDAGTAGHEPVPGAPGAAADASAAPGAEPGAQGSPQGGPAAGEMTPDERQELANLRAALGRQGNELGDLRREREEMLSRMEQLLSQRDGQAGADRAPAPDPYQEIDAEWYAARVEAITEDLEALEVTNAAEKAQVRAQREYRVRVKERQLAEDRRTQERQDEERRRDVEAPADALLPHIEGHLREAGVPGVTAQELAQAMRQQGVTPGQLRAMAPNERKFAVETLAYAALGRKAAAGQTGITAARTAAALPPAPSSGPAPAAAVGRPDPELAAVIAEFEREGSMLAERGPDGKHVHSERLERAAREQLAIRRAQQRRAQA